VLCLHGLTACRTFGRTFPGFGKDFQTAAELGFASSGIECAAWKSTQRTHSIPNSPSDDVLLSIPGDERTAAQKAATGKAKEKNPGSLTTFDAGEEPERPAEDKVLGGLQWMRIAGAPGF
jgi:hypothetical protein